MTEKNKKYTAADFDRYHAGTMPSIEMHELEKAALDDPFLADALEGYNYTPTFENDVIVLREKLNEKRNSKKVFSISSFAQSGWWRIAALLFIIAGATYFFYKLNYDPKQNALAKNDRKPLPVKQDSALFPIDTNKTINNIAARNDALSADSFSAGSKRDFASNEKNVVPKNENDKNISNKYLLKEKEATEKEKTLALASVQNNSGDKAAESDSIKFSMKLSKDSDATEPASVIGYGTKKNTLQKDSQPTIAMNKSESSADEALINSADQNKKLKETSSFSNGLNSRAAAIELNKSATPPLVNNEKFDQYIQKNIKPVYDENNKLLTGEVVLSFTINKKGRPHNIKVVQSSCKDCEKEAIHLLENVPGWPGEKQKGKTVSIKF